MRRSSWTPSCFHESASLWQLVYQQRRKKAKVMQHLLLILASSGSRINNSGAFTYCSKGKHLYYGIVRKETHQDYRALLFKCKTTPPISSHRQGETTEAGRIGIPGNKNFCTYYFRVNRRFSGCPYIYYLERRARDCFCFIRRGQTFRCALFTYQVPDESSEASLCHQQPDR